MNLDFWHDKWERMEIGFHLNEVNRLLMKFWPEMPVSAGETVLVPLCGKTLDLIWLRRQGYGVVGIELSEIALDALAAEFSRELGIGLSKSRSADGERVLFRGDGVLLIAGDFFAVSPELLQQECGQDIAAVYDRAAIVALPDRMRADYARQLQRLTKGAPQLLITLDYDQRLRNGPPFALSDAEVSSHYQDGYRISLLDERELIDQEPRFRAQGLDSFMQRVYRLERR